MDRIEKLYDRWSRGGTDEDDVHAAIDNLLETARIADVEETYGNLDESRLAVLSALADLAGIEPDYTGPWHVVRYSVTREYGGPEEGGWYYDWFEQPEPIATTSHSEEAAFAICRQFNAAAKEDRAKQGRPQGRFSVLGGEDEVYVVEANVGDHTSTERPHYE